MLYIIGRRQFLYMNFSLQNYSMFNLQSMNAIYNCLAQSFTTATTTTTSSTTSSITTTTSSITPTTSSFTPTGSTGCTSSPCSCNTYNSHPSCTISCTQSFIGIFFFVLILILILILVILFIFIYVCRNFFLFLLYTPPRTCAVSHLINLKYQYNMKEFKHYSLFLKIILDLSFDFIQVPTLLDNILMSVELSEKQPNQHLDQKLESVYDKFQKAQQNMSNFKQLLTKFSTRKKTHHHNPSVHAFTIAQAPQLKKPAINLILSEGWAYSGQTFEEKFHGYGLLLFKEKNMYSGEFVNGRMNGKGRLFYHQVFQELVDSNVEWEKYEGQFKDGNVTGFGNLFLSNGLVIIGYWRSGKPQYYTKVEASTFDN